MSNYYSVHAILAEEVTIPGSLTSGASSIGRALDPATDARDLLPGAPVELPLWLAAMLARRRMMAIRCPRWYNERMQRKMQAGPGCVDLRVRCPYFYDVAEQLNGVVDSNKLAPFVTATFQRRYKELLCKAHTGESDHELSRLQALLSMEEAQLFEAARCALTAFEQWRLNTWASRRGVKRRLAPPPAAGRQ